MAPNCEILKDFRDFSEYLGGFQSFSRDFRMSCANVCSRGRAKNLIALRERARQKVLYSDTRFRHVAGFPALRRL